MSKIKQLSWTEMDERNYGMPVEVAVRNVMYDLVGKINELVEEVNDIRQRIVLEEEKPGSERPKRDARHKESQ